MGDISHTYTAKSSGTKKWKAYAEDSCGNKDYGTWSFAMDANNKGPDYALATSGTSFSQSNGVVSITGPSQSVNGYWYALKWTSSKVSGTTLTLTLNFNIQSQITVTEVAFCNNFPGPAYVGSYTIGPSPYQGCGVVGQASSVICSIPVQSVKNVDGNLCNSCHIAVTIDGSSLWVKSGYTSNGVTHTLSAVNGEEEPPELNKTNVIQYDVYINQTSSGYSSAIIGHNEMEVRVEFY